MNKTVSLSELYPLIKEQLSNGGSASFTIRGVSMMPMLKNGIDSVRIVSPSLPLKKYDIPFYRRDDGSFILHRVVKVTGDGYVCRGDHQFVNEKNVTDGMIIGVTEAYTHNGKWLETDSLHQKLYSRFRVGSAPIRFVLARIKAYAKAVLRHIFKRRSK